MSNHPSICIPRISVNITRQKIAAVFNKYEIGQIQQIDIVRSTKGANRAFIHFASWNGQSELATLIRDRLENGDKINIMYEFPWYWKCSKSRFSKPQYS